MKKIFAILFSLLIFSSLVFATGEGQGTASFVPISVNQSQEDIWWSITLTAGAVKYNSGYIYVSKPAGWGNWQDINTNADNYMVFGVYGGSGLTFTTKDVHAAIYVPTLNALTGKVYIRFKNHTAGTTINQNYFRIYTDPDGGGNQQPISSQPYINVIQNTNTPTSTNTNTSTFTETHTPTATNTFTDTHTATDTGTPTDTGTETNTFTATSTFTDTHTATHTHTATDTGTATNTFTSTSTATDTSTATHTYTHTPTITPKPAYPVDANGNPYNFPIEQIKTPIVVQNVQTPIALKGGRATWDYPAAVSQYGAQMVFQTNVSGTPIMTPVPYDGKIRDDSTGNALDLISTSMGVYHMGSVGMDEAGDYYDTSDVVQRSGVKKNAQDMNIVAMSGTPVYSAQYTSSVAGTDYEYTRTALWAVPDIMIYSMTKTAQILTDYFENGMGLNTTMTAAGDFNTNIIPSYGTRLIFGSGMSITITPTSGKSVVIDGFVFSDLTGVSVSVYSSISPVAKFSTVGDYIMGYKAPINEPVYIYSSVSTTPDSVGWMKNREE